VAGVHYPVDSAHGGLLGFSLTLAFISHCMGGGAGLPVPAWKANANRWTGDFTLRKWCAEISGSGTDGWHAGTAQLPKAADWHLLPPLWRAAMKEWG
jgi:hypothetical protein